MDAGPPRRNAIDCLDEVIAFDATLAGDPQRLAAALRDLADDASGVQQLAASVRSGIPVLVSDGQLRAAARALTDDSGLRPAIADRLVRAWALALGVPDGHWSVDEMAAKQEATWRPLASLGVPRPTAFGPVGCAVWPDGGISALTLSFDGLLLASIPVDAVPTWSLIAKPRAPLSRAATVLRVAADRGVVAWTDEAGVWICDIARSSSGESITEPWLLAATSDGQARYPLALVPTATGEYDVLWTVDRRALLVVSRRAFGAARTRQVASPCIGSERLSWLDAAPASQASSWVLARTDRGRMSVARWDVGASDHDGWRPLTTPDGASEFAVVNLSAGPSVLASTPRGTTVFLAMEEEGGLKM